MASMKITVIWFTLCQRNWHTKLKQ